MNLQTLFNQLQGTKVLVPGQAAEYAGQCFQWVDVYSHDVVGTPYFYAPIALDFWTEYGSSFLNQYYDQITDGTIETGDIVVYGAGINSAGAGHADVALQNGTTADYVGSDCNWNTLNLEEVNHNNADNKFILGSLRPKANEAPAPAPTPSVITVRVNSVANVRVQPTTTAALGGSIQLHPGDTFQSTGLVTGQSVGGNNQWYHSTKGNYVWSGNCTRI